jgi:hypothetical protein
MDCKNARLVLELAHPLATELSPQDKEELAGHLAECPDCGSWAEGERRLEDHLGQAVRAVPVPPELSQRILGRLQIERAAWYRVRAIRAAGVAAVVLLVLGVGWVFWWSKRPAPDWNWLRYEISKSPYTAHDVEDSFAAQDIAMTAPPQFDYGHLESHGLREFQGQQVPYLVFLNPGGKDRPPAIAEVYVLSNPQFNIKDPPNSLSVTGGRKQIRILHHPDPTRQDTLYIVVLPVEAPLEVFFLPASKPA